MTLATIHKLRQQTERLEELLAYVKSLGIKVSEIAPSSLDDALETVRIVLADAAADHGDPICDDEEYLRLACEQLTDGIAELRDTSQILYGSMKRYLVGTPEPALPYELVDAFDAVEAAIHKVGNTQPKA